MLEIVSVQLDKQKATPLYLQLYEGVRQLIVNRTLSEGYRLPPIRRLAEELQVNNATVVNAYKLLEQHNYVYTRVGSGSYVADLPVSGEMEWLPEPESLFEDQWLWGKEPFSGGSGKIDLSSTTPTPDLFPVADFKTIFDEVLERDGGYAFGYQEIRGFQPLRDALAVYLRKQGLAAAAENIQIISGAQQGIDILAKVFLNFGDYIFTESPTYPGALAVFRSRGAKIIEIELEPDGLNMAELEDKLHRFQPKFIYVMPKLQCPTGATYSVTKRHQLLGLAKKYNTLIIEDDHLGELDFTGLEMAPLKAMDRDDRVIYLKSFSKVFMPGLRLGFLLVPPVLSNRIMAAKHTTDIFTSGLIQRALDLYLRKGIWQKQIKYMRQIYHERYLIMLDALQQSIPETVTYYPPGGGVSIWLSLPAGISAAQLNEQLSKEQIMVVPGSIFSAHPHFDQYLQLNFAAASPDDIYRGVKRLGELLAN